MNYFVPKEPLDDDPRFVDLPLFMEGDQSFDRDPQDGALSKNQPLFEIASQGDFEKALGAYSTKEIHGDPRLKSIQAMLDSGCHRFLASPSETADFDRARRRFPNFESAIDVLEQSVALHRLSMTNTGIRMLPLLLVGPPGIGKTRFISDAAEQLGLDAFFVNCASITAGFVLSGSSTQWGGGSPGKIYNAMLKSRCANPVVMLDEIDKLSGDSRFDGYGPLYTLLEDKTAAAFVDEAIDLPINCSRINWIATCNNLESIPDAIRSRFDIVLVEPPSKHQMRDVVISIFNDIVSDPLSEWGRRFAVINEEVIDLLDGDSPRDVRRRLRTAMGRAALDIIKAKQDNTFNPANFRITLDARYFAETSRGARRRIGF